MLNVYSFFLKGTVGDFEIGAKWQWKFKLHTITVSLLATLVALVSFIAIGCLYFWSQFAELSNTRLELVETRLQMMEIQRTIHFELEEIRRLKQDLDVAVNMQLTGPNYFPSTDRDIGRSKRSIAKGRGEHKSKEHTLSMRNNKKHNSTTHKSSSHLKHSSIHSKGISSFLVCLLVYSSCRFMNVSLVQPSRWSILMFNLSVPLVFVVFKTSLYLVF